MAAYPKFLDPAMVCGQVGACMKNMRDLTAKPTCDDCADTIAVIANILTSESDEIINFLAVRQV